MHMIYPDIWKIYTETKKLKVIHIHEVMESFFLISIYYYD